MTKKNLFTLFIFSMILFSALTAHSEPQIPAEEFKKAIEIFVSYIQEEAKTAGTEIPGEENIYDIASFAFVNALGKNRIPFVVWNDNRVLKFLKNEIKRFLGIWCYFPLVPKGENIKNNLVQLRRILATGFYAKTLYSLLIEDTAIVEAKLDRSLRFVQVDNVVSAVVSSPVGFFVYDDKLLGINPATGLPPVAISGKVPDEHILKQWTVIFSEMQSKVPHETQPLTEMASKLGVEQVTHVSLTFEALLSQEPSIGYYARLAKKLENHELSYEDVFQFSKLKLSP